MGQIFSFDAVVQSIPSILNYLPVTLLITIISMFFGLILGLLLALVKMNDVPVLKQITNVFVSFVRGTPLIVQLYLTYHGIPLFLQWLNASLGTSYNINSIPGLVFVLAAFSLNQAAFSSETIRSALLAVDPGEIEAGRSLGMTYNQILKRIILPSALVVALPNFGNSLISLMKGTSLAFVAAVVEMTAQAKIIAGANYRFFEAYLALAGIYWVITIIIEQILKVVERKLEIPESTPTTEIQEREA